jgi:hypothetical protein
MTNNFTDVVVTPIRKEWKEIKKSRHYLLTVPCNNKSRGTYDFVKELTWLTGAENCYFR